MNFFKKAKKGFTLVELVVVIAVIAILSAVSVGAYFGITDSANHSRSEQEAKQVYTQLQSKTLAGLDLGNSGTNVVLGANGLTFNGIYDDNILNELNALVYNESISYEVAPATGAIAEDVETSEEARIYFFANSVSGSAVATHMGYVPAGLSSKYVKYIELGTGELKNSLDGTYIEDNLSDLNLVKDRVSFENFYDISNPQNAYKVSGDYSTAYGTYRAYVYDKNPGKDKTWDTLQFKDTNYTGINMVDSNYKVTNISVKWDEEIEGGEGDIINVYGSAYNVYDTFEANPHGNLVELNYPSVIVGFKDTAYFAKLTSGYRTTSVKYIDFYFNTSVSTPDIPRSFNFYHNGEVKTEIVTEDTVNPITLNTGSVEVTWDIETVSGSVVATIDNGTVTNTNNGEGIVKISATPVLNPGFTKTFNIEYRPIIRYTYNLINKPSNLLEGQKIVFFSEAKDYYMGIKDPLKAYYPGLALDSKGPNGTVTFGDAFNTTVEFTNYSDIQVFTVKKCVHSNGNEYFAFILEEPENQSPQALTYASNGTDLKSGNLYSNYGADELKYTEYSLFEVEDINVETGAALIKGKNSEGRYIKQSYDSNTSTYRFSNYSTKTNDASYVSVYALNGVTKKTIDSITASINDPSLEMHETAKISYTYLPSYADVTGVTAQYIIKDGDESIIDVDDEGNVTPKAEGVATITVKIADGITSDVQVSVVAEKANDLITNGGQLVVGSKYIISEYNGTHALGTTQNSNNRSSAPFIIKDNKAVFNDKTQVLTLRNGSIDKTYAFEVEEGTYLSAPKSNENKLITTNVLDEYSSFTITIDENGVANIKANSSDSNHTKNIIKYNKGSNIFACYGSGQTDVSIYKAEIEYDHSPNTMYVYATNTEVAKNTILNIDAYLVDLFNEKVASTINTNISTIDGNAETAKIELVDETFQFTAQETGTYVIKFTSIFNEEDFSEEIEITVLDTADQKFQFNLGNNGDTTHADGSGATSYSETVGEITLTLSGSFYTGARDAKGNSCIKFGTSSKTSNFEFTVPNEVTSVIIYAAKYKTNKSILKVNNTDHTLTKNSNDGEYDEIEVDTTSDKTISAASVEGGKRCMINTIVFIIKK